MSNKSKLKKAVTKNINKSLFRRKVKRNRAFRVLHRKDSSFISFKVEEKKNNKEVTIAVKAGPNFELLKNTQVVIDYIAEVKSTIKGVNRDKIIFLDLAQVVNIDIGAICILLSTIKELNIYGINVRGNLPAFADAKKIIIESGYLAHMDNLSNKLQQEIRTFTSVNLILMSGADKSESKKVGECIKNAISTLTGAPSHYPPVYGMILEMNLNSVEHAYSINKHWLIGINIDTERKKIIFTYADNGHGILGTFRRKFASQIEEIFKFKDNSEILQGLFDRRYNSRFKKQYNRNKGLPVIKRAFVNKSIKNLLVITNDVSLHFASSTSLKLSTAFTGTFYYWEVDLETLTQ